jgi:hypothetical protein
VIVRAEVAVAEGGDLDAGVPDTGRFYQSRDHIAPGAEEIDAQPVLCGRREEAHHQVDAGHSLRYRLAQCPQRPYHRHAVSYCEVSRPAGPRRLRIVAHHAQAGNIGVITV